MEVHSSLLAECHCAPACRVESMQFLCLSKHVLFMRRLRQTCSLYIECVGGGGVVEWDTVTKKVIHSWVPHLCESQE